MVSPVDLGDLSYLTSTLPGDHDRVAAARSHEDLLLALDGTWRFHWSPTAISAPRDAAEVDLDDSDWEQIQVPSHWVLAGDGRWGLPGYTNVNYPIPLDPPHVPDENPTGDYRLRFTAPQWPTAERVLLRFDGIESIGLVTLNGQRVGVVRGSRLRTELDVTDLLVPGDNLLHVRVHQWSAMTYVEDQDQWWLPGIFRSVSLVGRPVGGIDDLWLDARYDERTGEGLLVPDIIASESSWPIRLEVVELGVDVTFDSPAYLRVIEVGSVSPWDCDSPRLYQAKVSASGEAVTQHVGFRSVRIENRQLLINGRPLRMRGVNRHEFDTDHGRIVTLERAAADLACMKRAGMNTVRTSHYPPAPGFLDLCDELGMFVILENDFETHGFELAGWRGNPSDDQAWSDHLVDRMRRTVERDKNHPSVIMWSLGNESGTGQNLALMAAWTRHRDPGRIVHYEGDYDGAYTDLVSHMYLPLEQLAELSAGRGTSRGRDAQASRLVDRPIMLCEYAHAMGNGPGGLAGYERCFELPGVVGGLIWEWRDHGIRTLIDGRPDFGYGGDFGERFHDSTFTIDGLTTPDTVPSPALAEVAAHFWPIRIDMSADHVTIRNLRMSADTSDLEFTLTVEGLGFETTTTVLDVPIVAAGGCVEVPLEFPVSDQELWPRVEARTREAVAWAEAGSVVGLGRLELPGTPHVEVREPGLPVTDWRVGPVELSPVTGSVVSWHGQPVANAHVSLWRAPTSNDLGSGTGSYELADPRETHGAGIPGPSSATRWRTAGLDRMMSRLVSITRSDTTITVRRRLYAAQATAGITVDESWSTTPTGARLMLDIVPFGRWECTWPRAGWHLLLPSDYRHAEWVGYGPSEAYPDSQAAGWLGHFAAPIDELTFPYVVPQETGHRPDLRHLEISGDGVPALRVAATGQGFTLSRHSAEELTSAGHHSQLPDSRGVHLYLDAAQHGLGTRSCGPDVRPEAQLWPQALRLEVVLS